MRGRGLNAQRLAISTVFCYRLGQDPRTAPPSRPAVSASGPAKAGACRLPRRSGLPRCKAAHRAPRMRPASENRPRWWPPAARRARRPSAEVAAQPSARAGARAAESRHRSRSPKRPASVSSLASATAALPAANARSTGPSGPPESAIRPPAFCSSSASVTCGAPLSP